MSSHLPEIAPEGFAKALEEKQAQESGDIETQGKVFEPEDLLPTKQCPNCGYIVSFNDMDSDLDPTI